MTKKWTKMFILIILVLTISIGTAAAAGNAKENKKVFSEIYVKLYDKNVYDKDENIIAKLSTPPREVETGKFVYTVITEDMYPVIEIAKMMGAEVGKEKLNVITKNKADNNYEVIRITNGKRDVYLDMSNKCIYIRNRTYEFTKNDFIYMPCFITKAKNGQILTHDWVLGKVGLCPAYVYKDKTMRKFYYNDFKIKW